MSAADEHSDDHDSDEAEYVRFADGENRECAVGTCIDQHANSHTNPCNEEQSSAMSSLWIIVLMSSR